MKKYVIGAAIFAVLLVIGFFGFSLVRANINDRTLPEEWRSWLPAQEETEEENEQIPEDVIITLPDETEEVE